MTQYQPGSRERLDTLVKLDFIVIVIVRVLREVVARPDREVGADVVGEAAVVEQHLLAVGGGDARDGDAPRGARVRRAQRGRDDLLLRVRVRVG